MALLAYAFIFYRIFTNFTFLYRMKDFNQKKNALFLHLSPYDSTLIYNDTEQENHLTIFIQAWMHIPCFTWHNYDQNAAKSGGDPLFLCNTSNIKGTGLLRPYKLNAFIFSLSTFHMLSAHFSLLKRAFIIAL